MIFSKPKPKEEIKQHIEAEIKKGLQFIGSKRINNNHILWEFNLSTVTLTPAKIEQEVHYSKGVASIKKKVITNENCQYFGSLNRKNAIKKLNKLGIFKIK